MQEDSFGVVVCSYNEEQTIQEVLIAIIEAVGVGGVVVVDDGSSDQSAKLAERLGVTVLRNSKNLGKGRSMARGVSFWRNLGASAVLFCDSDLLGLRSEHILKLLWKYRSDDHYGQVVGNRDWVGPLYKLQEALNLDLISGERIVCMEALEQVPKDCWKGYNIEVAINHVVEGLGLETGVVLLSGVTARQKEEKAGFFSGASKNESMFRKIFAAKRSLKTCGNCSCSGITVSDIGRAGVYSGVSIIRAAGRMVLTSAKEEE